MNKFLDNQIIELNENELQSITGGSLGEWIGCKIAGAVNAIKNAWNTRSNSWVDDVVDYTPIA